MNAMIAEKIMFFCPIPSFPRGEGIEDFSPTGRKKEGLIIMIQSQSDYTFLEKNIQPVHISASYVLSHPVNSTAGMP